MTDDALAWPDDDGCSNHWLESPTGHLVFAQWEGPTREWLPHDQPDYMIETEAMIAAGYTYLAPCFAPWEVAAREQAAAVAMRESVACEVSRWSISAAEEIEALPVETGALDAMLAQAREEGAKAVLCAARPDVAAVLAGEAVVVPRKLLAEAHACMRETGWHLATCEIAEPGYVTDDVLEAACGEIEASMGKLLADFPQQQN